jgi:type IV secretory pathway VirJ component
MNIFRSFARLVPLLPLVLLPWTVAPIARGAPEKLEDTLKLPEAPPAPGACFAILLTGDGGWAALDREVARRLAAADVPVVGWDSRAYYWTRRTPDKAATDLSRIIRRFTTEWKRPQVVVIGYSRGADVLPFLVNRLPAGDLAAVRLVALLGPGRNIDFEFHLSDFVHDPDPKTALAVLPEIVRLRGRSLLVIYGDKDESSCAPELPADVGRLEKVPGDHHFARDYDRLATLILDAAKLPPAAAKPAP